jgi:hypothetical protein
MSYCGVLGKLPFATRAQYQLKGRNKILENQKDQRHTYLQVPSEQAVEPIAPAHCVLHVHILEVLLSANERSVNCQSSVRWHAVAAKYQ